MNIKEMAPLSYLGWLTVHPADADHLKHGEEEQAHAAAGVVIEQLKEVHPALQAGGGAEASTFPWGGGGRQGTHPAPPERTDAHLVGRHPARPKEVVPCS